MRREADRGGWKQLPPVAVGMHDKSCARVTATLPRADVGLVLKFPLAAIFPRIIKALFSPQTPNVTGQIAAWCEGIERTRALQNLFVDVRSPSHHWPALFGALWSVRAGKATELVLEVAWARRPSSPRTLCVYACRSTFSDPWMTASGVA